MLNKYLLSKICLCAILSFAVAFAFLGDLDGLDLRTPDFYVSLGVGFNYDYLRSPLNVNFENARGYYSVNIPIRFAPGDDIMDGIFDGMGLPFTDNERFLPQFSARQHANTTISVAVPMLGGVCSFSHMNIMSLKYQNRTGVPDFWLNSDKMTDPEWVDNGIDLLMRGRINTPIDFSLGWEAITFGYVYRINELVTVALNLHRHRFYFYLRGNIDVDIYGRVGAEVGAFNQSIDIEYTLRNPIMGEYTLERWSPTFAARIWNFDLMARIMFKDKAKGALSAKYSLPFFIDPSNFKFAGDLDNSQFLIDNLDNFMANELTTVNLQTNQSMNWELPSVLTLKYNIIPESENGRGHLSFSYSKFIGRAHLGLTDPNAGLLETGERLRFGDTEVFENGLDLRTSLKLDHLMLFNARIGWLFGSLGIVSLDVDYNEEKSLLGRNTNEPFLVPYGKGAMLPILSGGGIIGTNLQLMMEFNIFPLPALKTGLVYNF